MPRIHHAAFSLAAAAAVGLAACSSNTGPTPPSNLSLDADLAASAGDAIATDVSDLVANEEFGVSGTQAAGADAAGAAASDSSSLTRTRTRTCYDAQGDVVTCGQGQTASAVVTLSVDGVRIGNKFTAIVHRQRHDSISGLVAGSTSRTHNGYGASQDTTTYTGDVNTRVADITASDSVRDLVFDLPRASNPWPVSGQIIRNLNATFTVTGAKNVTRIVSRRAVVTFPADAEGNVAIQLGTMSCTLNLVTRKVTNCTGS